MCGFYGVLGTFVGVDIDVAKVPEKCTVNVP